MQQLWINQQNNQDCIIFFNGWGMDENAIHHIDCSGFDVCMFYNYKNIEQINVEEKNYERIYLIAWSLGVWAASQAVAISKIRITEKIAINGTPVPINDKWGIHEKVFTSTLNGWNIQNRERFNIRMMGGSKSLKEYSSNLSNRTIDDTKGELQTIYANFKIYTETHIKWDRAIIGENDLIFTSKNQMNWWNGKTEIIQIQQPHYPFIGINNWFQIVTN